MTKIITIELLDEEDFSPLSTRDIMEDIADQLPELLKKVGIPYSGISIQIGSPDDPRHE